MRPQNILKNVLKIALGVLVTCFFSLVHGQEQVVIDAPFFKVDTTLKLVVANQDVEQINLQWPNKKSSIQLNSVFQFDTPVDQIELGTAYTITQEDKSYLLYFTQLPLISITTENTIVDEPRVHAQMIMSESNGKMTELDIGIEYRGVWSQTLQKKSYRIELWTDQTGTSKLNVELLNMRSDDDWNLQSMYNQPLRIRSKSNFQLWMEMDSLYYRSLEPKAKNGVQMEYVELFVGNRYQGVYVISERVDRKQLKLKKLKDNVIRGELYKGVGWGASTFGEYDFYDNGSLSWEGFEYEYPDDLVDWGKLYDFVHFVTHSDDQEFYANVSTHFNLNNAINYFLFLNLLRATDNAGKNIFVARYNTDEPYFYVPWDLDGTHGIIWNGSEEDITDDILTNGFYKRLTGDCTAGGFNDILKSKWFDLRQGLFQKSNLMDLFYNNYEMLLNNGVYKREALAWGNDPYFIAFGHHSAQLEYLSQWLDHRLKYLDEVFTNPCDSLATSISSIQAGEINIFPNPANQYIEVSLPASKLGQNFILKIFTADGRILAHKDITQSNNRVSLESILPGIYIVHLKLDKTVYTRKFIKR